MASFFLKNKAGSDLFCRMKSFWETNDLVLILMEFCEGKTLSDEHWEYKNHAMDESHAKIIMRKLVAGLETLWKIGYCHRDVKASNIMVKQISEKKGGIDYSVKWIDFGFAWPVNSLSTNFPGTTPYKSPEVILSERPFNCKAADVWSLGVVLFKALNGDYPYGGKCR